MGNIYGQFYSNAVAITPSDSADLSPTPAALLVAAGTGATAIKVNTVGGQTVVIPIAPGMTIIPLLCTRVYSTGSVLGTNGAVAGLW